MPIEANPIGRFAIVDAKFRCNHHTKEIDAALSSHFVEGNQEFPVHTAGIGNTQQESIVFSDADNDPLQDDELTEDEFGISQLSQQEAEQSAKKRPNLAPYQELSPLFKELCSLLEDGAGDTRLEAKHILQKLVVKARGELHSQVNEKNRNVGNMVSFAVPSKKKTKTHGTKHMKYT